MTLALSQALNEYLDEVTTNGNKPDSFHICVPANVRMSHYASEEVVQLENQFTVVPMCLPLLSKENDFQSNLN